MCLQFDLEVTERVRKQLAENGGWCRAFKGLDIRPSDRELTGGVMSGWVWRPGWHEAEGELPEAIGHGTRIGEGGFHVVLETRARSMETEFRALERDFVGAGRLYGTKIVHAVFRRLYLAEETYLAYFEKRRVLPPAEYTPSGHRRLRRVEWKVVRAWVSSQVESGVTCRALIDTMPRRAADTEPADPVVWYRPMDSHPGYPLRGRPLQSVAFESMVSTRPVGPPEAA